MNKALFGPSRDLDSESLIIISRSILSRSPACAAAQFARGAQLLRAMHYCHIVHGGMNSERSSIAEPVARSQRIINTYFTAAAAAARGHITTQHKRMQTERVSKREDYRNNSLPLGDKRPHSIARPARTIVVLAERNSRKPTSRAVWPRTTS